MLCSAQHDMQNAHTWLYKALQAQGNLIASGAYAGGPVLIVLWKNQLAALRLNCVTRMQPCERKSAHLGAAVHAYESAHPCEPAAATVTQGRRSPSWLLAGHPVYTQRWQCQPPARAMALQARTSPREQQNHDLLPLHSGQRSGEADCTALTPARRLLLLHLRHILCCLLLNVRKELACTEQRQPGITNVAAKETHTAEWCEQEMQALAQIKRNHTVYVADAGRQQQAAHVLPLHWHHAFQHCSRCLAACSPLKVMTTRASPSLPVILSTVA